MKKSYQMEAFDRLLGLYRTKIFRILWLLCIAILLDSPFVYGQQKFKVFSLKLNQVSVLDALREINRLSGNEVIFKREEVEAETKRITIDVKDATTLEIVRMCLEGTRLTCIERSNQVVVIRRSSITITGRITDTKRVPLSGATVMVKGDAQAVTGTSADINGNYQLTIPVSAEKITVSFIGYKSQEITIGGRNVINVVLEEELRQIEEVVVTGIFTRKAESFTGAARTFRKDELKQVGNTNIFQSLKNLDPSLKIMENMEMGSDPNTLPDMRLRGTSSFPGEAPDGSLKGNYQSRPNQPLFVLDGFEATVEEVFDLDMNRVESITILKDAASKAIYGSKAANGVIVIETVGIGTDGVRVTYSGNIDIEMPDLTSYNLCNAEEKLQVELLEGNVYFDNYFSMGTYYERLKRVREGLDEYWLSKPLRVGVGQKHSFFFEMGNKEMRTLLSISYNDVAGIMKESFRKTLSGNMQATYRKGNVLFRNIATITSNKTQDSPYGTFSEYTLANPYSPAYDENGKPNKTYELGGIYSEESPLYNASTNTKDLTSYLSFTNNFYIEWTIIEGLKATGRISIATKRSDADEYYPYDHTSQNNYSRDVYYKRGLYALNTGKSNTLSAETFVTYVKTINKHNLFGNIGWKISETKYSEIINKARGYKSEWMDKYYMGFMYDDETTPSGSGSINRDIGVLGVLGYTYDDRFLLDATLRGSAASVFGSDKRWATFWSVGLGWNIHNEKFIKDHLFFIEQIKLRGSIGYTGNQNFQSNKAIATYKFYTDESYNYYWSGAYLNNMENPGLQWELKKDYNIGIDLKIGRFFLVVDWYQSDTENMVSQISLPGSAGFTLVSENLGLVRNKGIEASLKIDLINKSDRFLNIHANIATNDNKLKKLSDAMRTFNEQQMAIASQTDQVDPTKMYYDGMHMNTIWAVPSAGIDPADGYEMYINKEGQLTKQWNAKDQIAAGVEDSKYLGNFGFNAEYKGIGASVTFTFLGGGDLYNKTLVDKVEHADIRYNVDKRVFYGRWKQRGEETQFRRIKDEYRHPVIDIRTEEGETRSTTRFVQKNNELNLSAVSLYYDFNRNWIKRYGFERLRLQANMNNVWKWSTIEIERGTTYPFARTLSISLTATL